MSQFDNDTDDTTLGAPLLCEREVAARWNRTVRTLQRWRTRGYGPAYLCVGGSIFYRVSDVIDFENRVRRGGGAE